MPNIASALKQEIARVARKVAKPDSDALKKQVAQQRSAVAALKRRIGALEKLVAKATRSGRGAARNVSDVSEEAQSERHRFSARGFAKLRQRFGISAAAMGQILGVSPLSVYKWESGKTRPRAQQVEKIAAVRGLGKREVAARLGQEGGSEEPSASGKQASPIAPAERRTRSKTARGGKSRSVRRTAAKNSARKGSAVAKRTPAKRAAKRAVA
ncbi:helix-turn-helix domain-containing protein [Ramlibacter henchirensis]|uniref:Helix-turn-helix domain-containing protein n=2 Tax=Ramlibacter henchirensis TaxID=204072 RepID=A0A4Z0BUH8_9BURK|nr:helix-turn-helix domain-containing protein [Ramlibacter henchirensis]